MYNDSQFPTLNHVCDNQHKSMTTKHEKDSCLVKDSPHPRCDIVDHVLPATGAGISFGVLLRSVSRVTGKVIEKARRLGCLATSPPVRFSPIYQLGPCQYNSHPLLSSSPLIRKMGQALVQQFPRHLQLKGEQLLLGAESS
jgi:hypothetical protein